MTVPTDQATRFDTTAPRRVRDRAVASEDAPGLPLRAATTHPRAQLKEAQDRAAAAEAHLLDRIRVIAQAEHRLKTPLTVLQGMALTLRNRRPDLSEPERVEIEESLIRNVRLLSYELDGLLAEAAPEVPSSALSAEDIDVAPIVNELARAFDGLGSTHHVTADVTRPLRAFVDPTALFQILGHLLDNAIKYSPDGGLITVRAATAAGAIVFEVIDQGVGLPAGVDVFKAFHRGPRSDRTPGIGLGLHIVRTLAEAMSGAVTAGSNHDAGSTFTVTLPASDRI